MILVLGVTHESRFEELVHYDIRPAMFRYEEVRKLSDTAVKMGKKGQYPSGSGYGMNRIGMKPDERSADMVYRMSRLGGVCIEGMFTHFAKADELDKTAEVIIDMLNTEAMSAAHIAYGTIVNDIREVSRSYKEARWHWMSEDFLQRQECGGIQPPWNRTPDLSAADAAVPDVY